MVLRPLFLVEDIRTTMLLPRSIDDPAQLGFARLIWRNNVRINALEYRLRGVFR